MLGSSLLQVQAVCRFYAIPWWAASEQALAEAPSQSHYHTRCERHVNTVNTFCCLLLICEQFNKAMIWMCSILLISTLVLKGRCCDYWLVIDLSIDIHLLLDPSCEVSTQCQPRMEFLHSCRFSVYCCKTLWQGGGLLKWPGERVHGEPLSPQFMAAKIFVGDGWSYNNLTSQSGFPLHVIDCGAPPWQNKSRHTLKIQA